MSEDLTRTVKVTLTGETRKRFEVLLMRGRKLAITLGKDKVLSPSELARQLIEKALQDFEY